VDIRYSAHAAWFSPAIRAERVGVAEAEKIES
jgi:hypothetical protein